MSSSRLVFLTLLVFAVGAIHAQNNNRIVIDVGDEGASTDLQSYLTDLHVAVASVQYTANVSARMLLELMDKLKRDRVKCECSAGDEKSARIVANESSIGRLDYRRTSPVAAHKLHTRPLKWNDARKSCRLEGAELATVESIDESQLLAKTLDEARRWNEDVNATESAFIGVHSQFEANDWVTVQGDAVPASRSVVVSSSSNASALHRCAVLTVHSNLNAADCNQPRPYLCEIRLVPT